MSNTSLINLNLPSFEVYSSQILFNSLSSKRNVDSDYSEYKYDIEDKSTEIEDSFDNLSSDDSSLEETEQESKENQKSKTKEDVSKSKIQTETTVEEEKKILLLQGNFLNHATRLLTREQLVSLSVVEVYDLDEIEEIGLPVKSKKIGSKEIGGKIRILPPQYDCIHFICQPDLKTLKHVITLSQNLRNKEKKGKKIKLVLNVFPRITYIAKELISNYPDIQIELRDLRIDLLSLDSDLLSMELNNCFRQCFYEGDSSSIFFISRSIMKLQSIYGVIPHIRAKGNLSTSISKMVQRMQRSVKDHLNIPSSIHTLILIDRSVDLITALRTQFSYESLIDEFFGIQNGLFEPKFTPCIPGSRKMVALDFGDRIFTEIRNHTVSNVGNKLRKKAQEIGEFVKMRESLRTAAVSEITNFTRMLPQLSEDKLNLEMHVNIVHKINSITNLRSFQKKISYENDAISFSSKDRSNALKYAEECIIKQEPLSKALRIACLVSLASNGISLKEYQHFRSEVIQSYGLHTSTTLNNLHELGLFTYKDSPTVSTMNWKSVCNAFNLMKNDNSFEDIFSTFGTCNPLSINVILSLLKKDNFSKLNLIPGAQMSFDQKVKMRTNEKICLVYFVGGVTRGEINVLRTLNEIRKEDDPIFLIATTNLMNGFEFVQQSFTKELLKFDLDQLSKGEFRL